MDIRELLTTAFIMPVVTLERVEDAVPLAEALLAGGMTAVEVTLRTPVALAAISAIAKAVPALHTGVGTVITPEDLSRAADAGASFAISPGQSAALLAAGRTPAIPLLPGVASPSDMVACVAAGYDTVKFFPAEMLGGTETLKILAGPFPNVRYSPSGGIDASRVTAYHALPQVVCVGGSWMVGKADIDARDWDAIRQKTAAAMAVRDQLR